MKEDASFTLNSYCRERFGHASGCARPSLSMSLYLDSIASGLKNV